ncbi:MAG: hypothetical protein A2787_04560 [Omnitrophica WOR_2 bacterium RIFCSPHIGHO2_01_FULL_48_9]|uniref:Response regulatory domain-containing protein n=1 Tax=Candidatus Sungbacteria bacterium RIFCSPHIGHO2_02_FULL_47_11 TaxID=1802270 RepID=A0A1G2KFC6_9BACT|nr:MAG: hypothetical protein A2787_04560 [Omnitrophica WOR_2 bacterium RIFCSPHIGHO2_01_FULL_48_9]OGZ98137.1 MAG: hypothetical protein A3C07_04930 [Candidatus Sungbacteria bacterium RIFCSPHIGHO2_02_FULL_47_11]
MAIKILVIDDEPDLCEMLKVNLEKTGEYTVVTSNTAQGGEALVSQHRPDLILLDNVMPGRNGSDLALRLKKKDSEFRKTPIIIVSGKGEMVYQKKNGEFKWLPNSPIVKTRGQLADVKGAEALAQAYGVDDYVAKPFKMEILLEVVQEVLKRTRKVTGEDKPPEEAPI